MRGNSSRAAERIAHTHTYQAAHRVVGGHSRASMIAATAAAAAVLGTTGFALGATPWAQADPGVAAVAQSGSHQASAKPGSFLFNSISGTKTASGQTVGGIRLDGLSAAAAAADKAHPAGQLSAPGGHPAATTPATRAPVKPPAATPAARKPAARKPAVAKPARKPAVAKPKTVVAPQAPYLIYDSVKPGSLPAGREVAVYATGHYATSAASVAGHKVLWIDTQGYDPAANILDVEPGDATPALAAQWVHQRLSANPHAVAIVYTMRAEWDEVKAQMATLPGWMHTKVRYWIADPTGQSHVVPGSAATQWYWGNEYDITTATPTFER